MDVLDLVAGFWRMLEGDPRRLAGRLTATGQRHVLPSPFDVTGLAAASILTATAAAAELLSIRTGMPARTAGVDTIHACAMFRSEHLQQPLGWSLPPVNDPLTGNYRTADGWIRLHVNDSRHRKAALGVLAVPADRARIAEIVAFWPGEQLEQQIVAAGGCAAVMYTRDQWATHPHGRIAVQEPAVRLSDAAGHPPPRGTNGLPLTGLRVLDLTRVIAGPVATRFLAAHGADVLRIDPPGYADSPALTAFTTTGKRCATLDLHTPDGRREFTRLVAQTDVLVCGLRPEALAHNGFDDHTLRASNPRLVLAELDAYGWNGPWASRRGFDSLVQLSSGLAAHPGTDAPQPLPAQALDYGLGYLLAAGICRALTAGATRVRGSLVGMSNLLYALGEGDPAAPELYWWPETVFEDDETYWGPIRRVRPAGSLNGLFRSWSRIAGPPGRDQPVFAPRLAETVRIPVEAEILRAGYRGSAAPAPPPAHR